MAALFRLPLLHPPVWREPEPREVPEPALSAVRPIEDPEGSAPTSRADCLKGGFNEVRPCRWQSCRHHLASTTLDGRALLLRDSGEARPTCVLDVAEAGEHSLEEVAEILGVTHERIRQIEGVALLKLKRRGLVLREFLKD